MNFSPPNKWLVLGQPVVTQNGIIFPFNEIQVFHQDPNSGLFYQLPLNQILGFQSVSGIPQYQNPLAFGQNCAFTFGCTQNSQFGSMNPTQNSLPTYENLLLAFMEQKRAQLGRQMDYSHDRPAIVYHYDRATSTGDLVLMVNKTSQTSDPEVPTNANQTQTSEMTVQKKPSCCCNKYHCKYVKYCSSSSEEDHKQKDRKKRSKNKKKKCFSFMRNSAGETTDDSSGEESSRENDLSVSMIDLSVNGANTDGKQVEITSNNSNEESQSNNLQTRENVFLDKFSKILFQNKRLWE